MSKKVKKAKKATKGKKWLKTVVAVIAVVVTVGAVWSIVSSFQKDDEKEPTTRIIASDEYNRYGLNATTGEANAEDISTISTESFYPIDDFDVTLIEGATIGYRVFYYDKDFAFIKAVVYDSDYDETQIEVLKEEGAAYVKIEIMPTADEDGTVSIQEKGLYAAMAEVTVSTKEVTTEGSTDEGTEETTSGTETDETESAA